MFQTSGYFKGLPCPYFESGLCERPYCHFGHFKSKPSPPTRTGPAGNPAVSGNILQTDYIKVPGKGEFPDPIGKPEVSSTFQKLDKVKWYNPTPIPKLLSHVEKERQRKKQKKPVVPEYKPTPIHLLKKSAAIKSQNYVTNIQQNDEYIPTPIAQGNTEKSLVGNGFTGQTSSKIETINIDDVKSENANLASQKIDLSAYSTKTNELNPIPMVHEVIISDKATKELELSNTESSVSESNVDSVVACNSENNISVEDVEKCRVEVLLINNELANVNKESELNDVVIVDESSSQDEVKAEVHSISSESEKCFNVLSDKEKHNTMDETEKPTSDKGDKLNKENTESVESDQKTLDQKPSDVHQCACSKQKENISSNDKKKTKSKKHKKHKKYSKHKSSKTSHKHKSHKRKKHKHKSSSKKSKYYSSSSYSESSSSSSASSSEDKSIEKKSSTKSQNRSSRKDSAEENLLKKSKLRSVSSSRSSSRGKKKQTSKEHSSKSEKSHKHSKASKRRHSSSSRSSSSSDSHRRHSLKRKKSTELKKSPKKCKIKKQEKDARAKKSSTETCVDSIPDKARSSAVQSKNKDVHTKTNEKRHVNIFDAINDKVSKDKSDPSTHSTKSENSNHLQLVEDSHSLLNNHLPPTPTASKPNKKPVFQKSMSHLALFGEDSDQEVPPENVNDNNRNDSDSDSVVLSSDSDLAQSSAILKQEAKKSLLLSVDLDDVDFSDNDPFDECLKIFNEPNQAVQEPVIVKASNSIQDKEMATVGKKREAHGSVNTKSSTQQRIEAERKKPQPSASQVMHSRLLAAQEQSLAEQEDFLQKKRLKMSQDPFNRKQRVAHTPQIKRDTVNTQKKATSTTKKDAREKKKSNRPIIPPDYGSKVPTSVRQQYLNKMIDDCLKIYTEDQDAYDRALTEEKLVYDRSNSKNVYLRVAVNAIKKLRDEITNKSQGSSKTTVSHSNVLGGAKAAHTHFTLNRSGKKRPLELTVSLFCEFLEENHLMTEAQLEENGFPRTDLEKPGHARFTIRDKGKIIVTSDKLERNCVRCGRRFHVSPRGNYVKTEECFYHWGKAWKRKIAGAWENKWTCCGGDLSSKGCQVCKAHVHEYNKYTTTSGFVKTLPCSPRPEDDCRVYSLDCEMVYTVEGIELGRVTVVDFNSETILEKLVKPAGEVIDYNTRFSGLTAAGMRGVKTSLRDVQAILLSLFTQKTILLGHSLESDLMALKLIHSNVVDTSIVFPHKLGLPYKRALKTLMGEYLQKIIQEDEGGHDSMEDASACMELMIWKAKNDLKYTKLRRL